MKKEYKVPVAREVHLRSVMYDPYDGMDGKSGDGSSKDSHSKIIDRQVWDIDEITNNIDL